MLNNVNTFNSAKMTGAKDLEFQRKYNALIDLLSKQLKVLSLSAINGMVTDASGSASLGLASSTSAGALSAADWGTFNGKQDQSNELDALSGLADTAGFVKKTGDGAYSIDTSVYLLATALSNADFSLDWEDDTTHAATKGALYDFLYGFYIAINAILGSGEYTEDNYVTDMASVTANIDALDMALGSIDIWGAM
jgi:hypothetical protein